MFLLALPMAILGVMSLSTATLIAQEEASGEALRTRLGRHRFYTQLLGVISIFITALWGMYQNLSIGAL